MREVRARMTLWPMIFVIVLDVLNALICLAEQCDLLKPPGNSAIKCQASGADDLVVLVTPFQWDFIGVDLGRILGTFDERVTLIRLRTNLDKCQVTPIRCSMAELAFGQEIFGCEIAPFPCHYIGVPFSIYKLDHSNEPPLPVGGHDCG